MGEWRTQDVEILKSMTADGASASQIARAIGGGVTRNAVINKRIRLGLASNTKPSVRSRVPMSGPVLKSKPLPPPPPVELDPLVLEGGEHVTLLTVNDRCCRWPIGDPCESDFHFCGHAPAQGSPYCEAHARKSRQAGTAMLKGTKPKALDGRWT